jgi:hypothetical protein
MNFPWKKAQVPKEKGTFSRERPKFPRETYVPNLLQSQSLQFLFYMLLWPIIEKVSRRDSIFVGGNISIQNSYAKVMIKKKIWTHLFPKET